MIHQVVLEAFGLFGIQRESDVAAHAGIDAVDTVAGGEALLQFYAALPDARARRLGKLHARLAAGYVFHIFDRDRAKAQDQAVWHDYIRRQALLFDCKALAGLGGLAAHAVMRGD